MRTEPRTHQNRLVTARLAAGVALLAMAGAVVFMFGRALAADQPVGNSVKGFRAVLEYFDKPHEYQMRSLLEGSESEMGPNGIVIIHDAKLHTFHEDGSQEMLMNAPRCLYDYTKHVASSTGALQLQTWDENSKRSLQLQGSNGFYWQETNSYLIVSNRQITRIGGSLTNTFIP